MKFLICIAIVICVASRVLSADTTSSNPIEDALAGLDKLGQDLIDKISNATSDLGGAAINGTNSLIGSGTSSGFLTPILNLISTTLQSVINGISKPITNAINNLVTSITKNIGEQVTKISNLTACANSTIDIEQPLANLLQCASDSLTQATEPVDQGVQVINKIATSITADINNALKCAASPIFIFPNLFCFANAGLQTVINGFSNVGYIVSLGATIVNNLLTLIPNNFQCANKQLISVVESLTQSGVNVAQCLI